jgi:hypothetical protein
MLFRVILYVMVGYFIYRLVQVAGKIISPGRRPGTPTPPPEPEIKDFKDIKDADFIDITPKERGTESPKGS